MLRPLKKLRRPKPRVWLKRVTGQRHERGRDSGKAEINKKTNNKNKCRVDKTELQEFTRYFLKVAV